jgi:hypothetical protein
VRTQSLLAGEMENKERNGTPYSFGREVYPLTSHLFLGRLINLRKRKSTFHYSA